MKFQFMNELLKNIIGDDEEALARTIDGEIYIYDKIKMCWIKKT